MSEAADERLSSDSTHSTIAPYTPGDEGEEVPNPPPGPAVVETPGKPAEETKAKRSSSASSPS